LEKISGQYAESCVATRSNKQTRRESHELSSTKVANRRKEQDEEFTIVNKAIFWYAQSETTKHLLLIHPFPAG
jgi:hypothetical protein